MRKPLSGRGRRSKNCHRFLLMRRRKAAQLSVPSFTEPTGLNTIGINPAQPGKLEIRPLQFSRAIMSKSKFVRYCDRGFWAYDVALGVFLKHLIDVGEPLVESQNNDWLKKAILEWRVAAVIDPYGLKINQGWSPAQLEV